MGHERVLELLRRDVSPEEHHAIRELWKAHSKAEDARDIAGLMATLTGDCLYEFPQTGHRWEGHAGATRFYQQLLAAFPDIDFSLTHITIGPQGVVEEANVAGTHRGEWLGLPPSGEPVHFQVVINFPWDRDAGLFTGERVYAFGIDLPQLQA